MNVLNVFLFFNWFAVIIVSIAGMFLITLWFIPVVFLGFLLLVNQFFEMIKSVDCSN